MANGLSRDLLRLCSFRRFQKGDASEAKKSWMRASLWRLRVFSLSDMALGDDRSPDIGCTRKPHPLALNLSLA